MTMPNSIKPTVADYEALRQVRNAWDTNVDIPAQIIALHAQQAREQALEEVREIVETAWCDAEDPAVIMAMFKVRDAISALMEM